MQDIKSANVLVFPDNTVKICDFGSALSDAGDSMEVRLALRGVFKSHFPRFFRKPGPFSAKS